MYKNSIILLDLDHTLYNAVDPWRDLVAKLFISDLNWKRFPWRTYYALREHYKVFELFFEKSFRHYWLSEELLVLLLGIKHKLISSNDLLNDLTKINMRLSLLSDKECRPSNILQQAVAFTKSCNEFKKVLQLVKEKKGDREIVQIEKKFRSEANISCYDGVFDLLNLFSENHARFYLVSEGDYELQLWKIKLLGIHGFFENKILVTESYKKSQEYLINNKLIKKIIFEKNYSTLAKSRQIQDADSTIRKYELLRFKEDLFFYYAILKSIMLNPKKPERVLISTDIDELIDLNNLTNDKVVMVGDRVDKDILPIWKIKGNNSDLIRIRSGKYKKKDFSSDIPKSNYKEFHDFLSVYNHFAKSKL